MSDHKRNASSIAAAMEASIEATMSKKMKTDIASCQLQLPSSGVQLRSSHVPDTAISPATSLNSTETVVSEEHLYGRLPLSFSSVSSANNVETIGAVENSTAAASDLETSVLEAGDSTYSTFKLFSKDRYSLNDFCGDSEEMKVFPVRSSVDASENRKFPASKMAPKEEIEEFLAMAEKYEQKRFAEKYNYDIVKDMPLQGKYEWVRLI
ncbi:cyclin-dependent kinase inhibitor 7-like [Prosopis cineraria]|uniref:cyclin-dependent kinase inhibitor 7-like n=1 Tax=Prosopis cineraria TaxID=364024 RepID=UPI00240EED35|nr:cyclin-dependent kinase inhibitor 7-like [Prosopis cineraria]